jgi:uncharacterized protein YtpQ (UPF0354 family)
MALFSQLSSWLGRGKAGKPRFADITECRAFVIATFKQQPDVDSAVADLNDPAKFTITMGGRSLTGDVTNIFGYLSAYPAEDVNEVVGRFIRSLRSTIEAKAEIVGGTDIVAVVRNQDYIDHVARMGLEIVHEPLGADLTITYMADRPDSMSPIAPKDVGDKDMRWLRQTALNNVRQWLPKVVADDQLQLGTLYFVQENTMLSTSLILLDEFWKSIEARFPGDVLIALPRRDQLFIFDDGDPAAKTLARRLIDVTIRDNFNLLSQKLYARRSGKIVLVTD